MYVSYTVATTAIAAFVAGPGGFGWRALRPLADNKRKWNRCGGVHPHCHQGGSALCPRRKKMVDWKIGVKHCPCGQPNHLDEDYCVRCDFPFGDNPSRRNTRKRTKSGRFFLLVGAAVLTTVLAITLLGIDSPSKPTPTTAQTSVTYRELVTRIRTLENKVLKLEQDVHAQGIVIDKLAVKPMPLATSIVDLNPVPAGSVLVVQVERGNVRSGPGTTYPVIGYVKSGQVIEGVLGRHDNGWYRVCCTDENEPGWLAGSLVVLRQKAGDRHDR